MFSNKLKILTLCAFLSIAARVEATISRVQFGDFGTSGVTSQNCSLASTVTAGDIVVFGGMWGNQSGTFTVSDSLGNTWTAHASSPASDGVAGGNEAWLYWSKISTGGASDTLTVSIAGGGSHSLRGGCIEYASTTGFQASPLDVANSNFSSTGVTTGNTGAVTPSVTGDLLFAVFQANAGWSAGTMSTTNCTEEDGSGSAGTGFAGLNRVVGCSVLGAGTSAITPTFSWTGSSAYSGMTITFKVATGGGATPAPQLMNMGVGMASMSIDYPALAAWRGCVVGDTSCSMEVDLCDENKNCLRFPPGKHQATLQFVKNGTPTAVGSSSFAVITQ